MQVRSFLVAIVEVYNHLCHLSPSFGLQKTSGGYNLAIPEYNPASSQAFTWVAHDVGATVVPLLKQYDDPEKDISGKVYPIVTARMTFPELVKILSKGMLLPRHLHKAWFQICSISSSGEGCHIY